MVQVQLPHITYPSWPKKMVLFHVTNFNTPLFFTLTKISLKNICLLIIVDAQTSKLLFGFLCYHSYYDSTMLLCNLKSLL